MSTTAQDTGNIPASNNAQNGAALFSEPLHRGADAISNMAQRTADQIGKARQYLSMQGGKLKQQGENLTVVAREHPVYSLVAVGLIGFGLGIAARGWAGHSFTSGRGRTLTG